MITSLRVTGLSVALTFVLLTAGCGGSDNSAEPTATANPATTTPTVTPPPTPTPTMPSLTATIPTVPSDGGTPTCTTKQLGITVKPSSGGNAAGSSYSDLTFTNKGSGTCAIFGWPGVSYVGNGNGTQIGAPADRTGTPKPLRLKAGQAATALLREVNAGNFDDSCKIHAVEGLRIYPPNQTAAVFVAHKTQGCASASTHTLVVAPVVATG